MTKPITSKIIIASILASALIQTFKGDFNWPLVLGGAFAFILGPFIVATIVKLINKVLSREFTDKSFLKTFLITWIILVLLNFLS